MLNEHQKWVSEIRKDPKLGVGTCSVVDECYDDSDLHREIIGDEKPLIWDSCPRTYDEFRRRLADMNDLHWERSREIDSLAGW